MNYIEVTFTTPDSETSEIMMAELAEIGFESFAEKDQGFLGYIVEKCFLEKTILEISKKVSEKVSFNFTVIKEKNWNEVWENNFEPVVIGDLCVIRAPFHEPIPGKKYEIIIEPKMSFGTGHHETTSMMISLMGELNLKNLSVLDMGCGTGILAILAAKMGATSVLAIDNDEWAFNNSLENIKKNAAGIVNILMGDASLLSKTISEKFDIVLANINRNILLDDIEKYTQAMKPGAKLLLSGFYQSDRERIINHAGQFSLKEIRSLTQNNWMALVLEQKK
jgi:ribosomal protein L11 methyltransferase